MNYLENPKLKEDEYYYNCNSNLVLCKDSNKIKNFKLINISEDNVKNVWLMCRKDTYKFKIKVINFKNYYYVKDEKGEYTSFDNKYKLKKIYKEGNFSITSTSDKFNLNTYEDDIMNEFRFSIDYIDNFEVEKDYTKYRVIYLDIETHSSIDVINTPEPIISISYIDSFTNEKTFMTWNNELKEEVFVKNGIAYMTFLSEKDMLNKFINDYQKYDIVTGWNILGFDMIYLYNRLWKLKLNGNNLSPTRKVYNKIKVDDDRFFGKKFKIHGIDVMDMKDLVKDIIKFSLHKPTNLTLDKVATFFLQNVNKIKLEKGIAELWSNKEIDKLAEYNIRDVEILKLLDYKLKLFFYYVNIRNILPSVNLRETQYNSIIVDKMIFKKYKHLVFPNKKFLAKLEFEGAYVSEPKEGVRKHVGVFDFNALYPNIIKTFNISPDSLCSKDEKDTIKVNDKYFSKSKNAILPELVNELIKQRYEYKKLKNLSEPNSQQYKMYESMETAFKAIVNSIYGVFGLPSFRLYSEEIASSITYMGRYLTQTVEKFVNSKSDFENIYNDTDSSFIYYKGKETEFDKIKEEFDKLENEVNIFIVKHVIEEFGIEETKAKQIKMECETIFTKLISPKAKKKYLGLVKMFKGKMLEKEVLYGRNIEIIRRDTPDAIKKILNKLMLDVLNIDDMNLLKDRINFYKKEIKSLQPKDLLITKQINRHFEEYKVVPQHVRAMMYSNEHLHTTFSRDNYKGGMLFVKNLNSKYPTTDVLMLDDDTEMPKEFQVDYEKYFNLYIERKLILLCESFSTMFSKNKTLEEWGINKNNFHLLP